MRLLLSFLFSIFLMLGFFVQPTYAVDPNSVDIGPIVIKKEDSADPSTELTNLQGHIKYRIKLNGQTVQRDGKSEHQLDFLMERCVANKYYTENGSNWPNGGCGDILAVSNFGDAPYAKYYESINLTNEGDARIEIFEVYIQEPSTGGAYTQIEGGSFPRLFTKGATTGTVGYSWRQPVDTPQLNISPTTINKQDATDKTISINVNLGQLVDQAYNINFQPLGNVQVVCDNPEDRSNPGCRIRLGESGDNYQATINNTSVAITLRNIQNYDARTYTVTIGHPRANQTIEGTFAVLDGSANNSLNPVLSPSSMTGEQSKNGTINIKIQNPLDSELFVILPHKDRNGRTNLSFSCSSAKCDVNYLLPAEGLPQGPHVIKIIEGTTEKGSATLTITTSPDGNNANKHIGCSPTEQNDPNKKCTTSAGIACGDGGIETAIGCIPTEPTKFINGLMLMSAGLAGGIALLLMIQGSLQMITSQGNADALKKGREQFVAAISGLLFIIFSVTLLQIIGVDILQIPGFTR